LALTPGTRLGPYEVTALIGEGGMGQVYRARDTKLDRDVALKVLPDSFVHDLDRLARFQREAKVLASLNHPNIAHIHGLEESNGVQALVMELVEGEDLAQRLTGGAIPIDEALPIARQIADALEAAHEQGIIHRDLKPANIKVRDDGTVKVLDFGLAKAMEPIGPIASMSQSPTITTPAMTQAGMILGTAAYMSPEQAKGRPADKRSDIWAFGCVLFEMLTGLRAFGGEDVTDTLAAIVRGQPDWIRLPGDLPAQVTRLLKRCLEKDIRVRLQHVGDARLDLNDAISEEGPSSTRGSAGLTRRRAASMAILATVVGSLVAALVIWTLRPAPNISTGVSYLSINVDPVAGLGGTATVLRSSDLTADVPILSRTALAFSPDGRRLVFVGEQNGNHRLYVRALQEPEAKPIAGTEGALNPFFSPDGLAVGFWANGQLKKIAIAGGPPDANMRSLVDLWRELGLWWSHRFRGRNRSTESRL
jgi:serine/threonine protein kinase